MIPEVPVENILQKAISSFTLNQKFHICVHDTSGALYTNPLLNIATNFRNHTACFCQNAKITATGLRFCLRCKAASLRKAVIQRETYIGQCYLGMAEIVRPVIINDKMVCVIYIGNLFWKNKKDNIIERITRVCKTTGACSSLLIDSMQSSQLFNDTDIPTYNNMLDVLEHLIKVSIPFHAGQNKSDSISPIYCQTNHWAIESIQNYILEFYNKDLKLSHLAKLYFLNPDYLCRLFHKETGMSFSEYINNTRITQAKSLLEFTDTGIMNISTQIGFSNVTYFNRLFKKTLGVSPKEYRLSVVSKNPITY